MDTFGFTFTPGSDTWMWKRPHLSASTVVWIWEPQMLFSDIVWGLFRCQFSTTTTVRRTPFGVAMRLHVTRPLQSTCLVLTSKQYLHIHYIINRIKWLQCFKININMLPVDQEALNVTDRSEEKGTWSLTSQLLLVLILTAGICGNTRS